MERRPRIAAEVPRKKPRASPHASPRAAAQHGAYTDRASALARPLAANRRDSVVAPAAELVAASALVKRDLPKWAKIVKDSGATID